MILRRRFVLPFLFILLWAGCRNCSILELRMNDRELMETINSLPYPHAVFHQRVGDRSIRYLSVGYDSLPKLILLHGSPSSLSAWRTIYTDPVYLRKFQVIAIDRPGYGYSGFGDVETDLQKQVALIQPLVDSMTRNNKAILFGSSYGGPVAAQLAMNFPDRIIQLVLLSASVMPGQERIYWVSYPMTTPILAYLFPPTFVMSSREKLAHKKQLGTLKDWARIKTNLLIIHGNKDKLVYYSNALYARKQLVNAKRVALVTMNGRGHSIIFSRPDLIKRILSDHLVWNEH
jgi:pimeloyl-ACP methyl ester carboxylesterase